MSRLALCPEAALLWEGEASSPSRLRPGAHFLPRVHYGGKRTHSQLKEETVEGGIPDYLQPFIVQ